MSTAKDSHESVHPAHEAPEGPGEAAAPPPPESTVTEESTPAPAPAPRDVPAEQPRDPKVAQLKALFPDLEDGVLQAVLEGCGGSLDEATEQLLVMSDPNFKTDTTELSQLEADEELARQLAREDELAQAQHRVNAPHRSTRPHAQQEQPSQSRPLTYQAYVPKSRRTAGGGPASPSLSSWKPPAEPSRAVQQDEQAQGQHRDELQELTEQFNKVADTGKRMFGSFLSKAKEQIARVDEAIVRSASPPTRETPPAPPPKPAHPPRASSSSSSWTAPSPLPRPSNAPPRSTSSQDGGPVVMVDRTGLTDVGRSTSPAALETSAPPPASAAPASSSSNAPAAVDSPKKDFSAKIPGLLPRQSFSLLDAKGPKSPLAEDKGAPGPTGATAGAAPPSVVRSPLSAPNHALGDDESDDEFEYTKSPFDDD